ncbi:Ketohexokinase [hydrothermal vent metagenome]|uniref:Ketohexokinase n=1 Tax=hydrothermal vent metagenome TaxID=652676 RepID=A0A3B0ZL27_9ZZZZ
MPQSSRVLGVGIATLDIVNTVATYPSEDEEIRALNQRKTRGGNATNTLVVLNALGHQCDWAGVLTAGTEALFIKQDLDQHQIDYKHCLLFQQGTMPTSYITLAQNTASRSIVHHRNLPEYDYESYQKLPLQYYDWIHFEGRNVDETRLMLQHTQQSYSSIPISLEIEKPREHIESLFPYASVILFAKNYILAKGYTQPQDFLQQLATALPNATLISAWGDKGAYAISHNKQFHQPAYSPEKIIDTLGAGDTFNAGIIDSMLKKQHIDATLEAACRLAGKKCGHIGLIKENNHDHHL